MAVSVNTSNLPFILKSLLDNEKIEEKDINNIIQERAKHHLSTEQALVNLNIMPEEDIAKFYANNFKLQFLTQDELDKVIQVEAVKGFLPEKFCRENFLMPIAITDSKIDVVVVDPSDMLVAQEIQLYTGLSAEMFVSNLSIVMELLDTVFGVRDAVKEITSEMSKDVEELEDQEYSNEDILDLNKIIPETGETQIVRLVNRILENAIRERASDIHIEPFPKEIKIRYRIDGALRETTPPPRNLYIPLISRLKILCKMDIAEKRIPQDSAFSVRIEDKQIDLRVSTVPTVYGEKMVMRILNKDAVPLNLKSLGFDDRQLEDFIKGAESPHGLIFVTGPTGSGKSTTLYSTLQLIISPEINIHTIEDPVEYKFDGINQVQVKPQVGLTFASALRSFLRQDPDVIMVGEVRDNETAEICLKAALTGHLVLSTLHTNDAISSITRLQNMGIEAFLLASTLRIVEAQRLIRRLCPNCKEEYTPSDDVIKKFKLEPGAKLFRAKGCPECRDLGYKGRVGLYEVVRITPGIAALIEDKASLSKIREQATKEGMDSMFDCGLKKVKAGITSLEELMTVVLAGEE